MNVSHRMPRIFDAARYLGAWQLRSWEIRHADGGATTYPYGEDPIGWLIYTPDGRMSATISRRARAPLSAANARKAKDAEKVAAFDTYLSYSGSFVVDDDVVVHRVELSLNPNLCGTEQRRTATFEDRRLTLSADEEIDGARRSHRLVWERPAR